MTEPDEISKLARELTELLPGSVRLDHDLGDLTTYRIGGPAAILVEPVSQDELIALAQHVAAYDAVPVLALGRGSNLVVSDRGWSGIVVRLGEAFAQISDGERSGELKAGGAVPLPQFANKAARRGLAGAEFMVAIPGSVGGAIRMNAGAHGMQISDILVSARVVDLARGEVSDVAVDDLALDYRRSNLGDRVIVASGLFRLTPADPEAIRARIDGFRRHRAATQPGAVQNAGSVFKNPPGDHAGRLVEAAGLKGFRVGGAHVSELHANFFMAGPKATSQDVYDLVAEVKRKVRETFGIDLEPEIRFAGRFEPQNREVEVIGE